MKRFAHYNKVVIAGLASLVMMSITGCAGTDYLLAGRPDGVDSMGRQIYQYCTNAGRCITSYNPQMSAYAFYYDTAQH
ncbi:MAG: hypothetical protein ACYDEV_13740 [Acidiferrobacter sp.]